MCRSMRKRQKTRGCAINFAIPLDARYLKNPLSFSGFLLSITFRLQPGSVTTRPQHIARLIVS